MAGKKGFASSHLEYFMLAREHAEKASRRKGERPQDLRPRFLLVAEFLMRPAIHPRGVGGKVVSYTSQLPLSYPPCVRPIRDLEPLMISHMKLETHHRGSRTIVCVRSPPDRTSSVMAIVEDEEETGMLLQLYNQPEESKADKDYILQLGDILIIKEPFFVTTLEGDYCLRVDHVSDVVWLQDGDPRIPPKWRHGVYGLDENSQDIRSHGNAAVKKQNWAEAERLYTYAIRAAKTPEEEQLAHLNRSLTNLRLDRPRKALDDACKGNPNTSSSNGKALFREARALYSLGKFGASLEKLLASVRIDPKNSGAWAEIKRVKQRLREEESGSYKFSSMYKQAEATPPLIDCATYVGSVAIRDSPHGGKGLFTTKKVRAGELLLCEKAYAYSYADTNSPIGLANTTVMMNYNTGTLFMGGQANLITQIVQKLYHNHADAEVFTSLHRGDYNAVPASEVDGVPVVDTFLVARIVQLNYFTTPRTTYQLRMVPAENPGQREDESANMTAAIWPIASRINHSCLANCDRSFIGDMIIIRACEDMAADTELYFKYAYPSEYATYEEVQADFERWGLVCGCLLCLEKKSTPLKTVQTRKFFAEYFEQTLKQGVPMEKLTLASKILEDIEKTYTPRQDGSRLPHFELSDPYFRLGVELMGRNKLADGLEMLLKGLESLGFVVVACPPRKVEGKESKKKAMLEIKRWGQVHNNILGAFSNMIYAYKKLAPELCQVVKEYAGVVYSIRCGEQETMSALYPVFS